MNGSWNLVGYSISSICIAVQTQFCVLVLGSIKLMNLFDKVYIVLCLHH